jgi:hypothetical protein
VSRHGDTAARYVFFMSRLCALNGIIMLKEVKLNGFERIERIFWTAYTLLRYREDLFGEYVLWFRSNAFVF